MAVAMVFRFHLIPLLVLLMPQLVWGSGDVEICRSLLKGASTGYIQHFDYLDHMQAQLDYFSLNEKILKEISSGKRSPTAEEINHLAGFFREFIEKLRPIYESEEDLVFELKAKRAETVWLKILAAMALGGPLLSRIVVENIHRPESYVIVAAIALAIVVRGGLQFAAARFGKGPLAKVKIPTSKFKQEFLALEKLVRLLEESQTMKKPSP